MRRNPITVGHVVQLVDNKFTNYMEQDVDQWEMNEANREKQVLGDVKELLLKHAEHCWRIYMLTAVMGSISLFFHCFSSPGMLIGGLNYVLVAVLIWQLITVWMRQQKAYYYVDLVNEQMWPILFRVMRTYAPYITLPFAGLIGVIGYNMENLLSDKFTPYQKSVSQQRKDRQEAEAGNQDDVSSLKERKFVARTVFEKNLSPSLQN